MSKTWLGIRIAGAIVVVWLVIATGMIGRICDAYGLYSVDRYLATCDWVDVSVCVPATGHRSQRKIVRPSEIQELRYLIGASRGRLLSEWDKVVIDLPGCGGQMPEIELTLWQGSNRLATIKLEGSLLRLIDITNSERPYYLDSDAACRKFCADAGVRVPWGDYGM